MKNKENSIFDITKIVLAVMVVCIHSQIYPNILYPWLRLAVPLFYIISSYFLFGKINKLNTKTEKDKCLKKYINRNLTLYLFWFIVLLIPTIVIRNYFAEKNIILGLMRILKNFAFSSTFKASWFIMAGIISTTIIYNLSKRISNKLLLILTSVIYIMICIKSSYMFIFDDASLTNRLFTIYEKIFTAPQCSFPVALLWITCGKCIAEKTINISKRKNMIVLIASMIFLYIEWLTVKNLSGKINNDCYIFLAPLCISIFNIIKNIKPIEIKHAKELRNLSTVMYVTHATIISSTKVLLNHITLLNNKNIVFCFTIILCISIYIIIKQLEKSSKFKFLKYSY